MPSTSPLARVGLALLALAGSVAAQNNKLTSTPANFRGFYILDNGAVSTVTCSSGATFFTSSTYGACCSTDNCNFATTCVGGTASRIFGGTFTCDTEFPDCYAMTVYASYPSAAQSWIVAGCATNWRAFTIYREIVTSTSAPTTSRTTNAFPTATPTDSPNGDDDDGSSGQLTTPPTGGPTGTPQPATDGASRAWIAGAVIGPIAGLALIGLAAFWIMRRKRAAAANQNLAVASEAKPAPPAPDAHQSAYYAAGSPGIVPAPSPGTAKYYQGEPPSAVNSTPSPVGGYAPQQPGMYQQQPPAGYAAAPYPPQQAQYPPQYPAQHGQYSPPQAYPAQFGTPPPPVDHYPSPHSAAELPSGRMTDVPQELGDGAPVRK